MTGKKRQNCIFLDTKEDDGWELAVEIRKSSGIDWKVIGWDNAGLENGHLAHFNRIFLYFIHGIGIFAKRKRYDRIIAWQQFYGVVFAFICSLFHVRKLNKLYIFTFIYKEKSGKAGKLFFRFVNRAVSSEYVDSIYVYSPTEVDYYNSIFDVPEGRFEFVPLGFTAPIISGDIPYEGEYPFLLAAGRSNRDYGFLLDVAGKTDAQIVIVCDNLAIDEKDLPPNVHLYRNVFGDDYYRFLDK